MTSFSLRFLRMLVYSSVTAPFKTMKRAFFGFLLFCCLPMRLWLCSYLEGEFLAMSDVEFMGFMSQVWAFFFAYRMYRMRYHRPGKLAKRFLLWRLYAAEQVGLMLQLERVVLCMRVVALRTELRINGLRVLYASRRANRSMSADASRASRESSRYKNLLKRFE